MGFSLLRSDLTGTGAQDTAIASHAYASAQKAGVGTMIKS
jgi:ornithine cyclodeaminase/alanine dehydrogenase-like protein (mu-crystallin family)